MAFAVEVEGAAGPDEEKGRAHPVPSTFDNGLGKERIMDWGLLWYDDTAGRPLEDKVARAAAHFEKKYGQPPTLCFVHPTAKNGTDQVGNVQIEALKVVLPNCLWIGVGEIKRKTANGKRHK